MKKFQVSTSTLFLLYIMSSPLWAASVSKQEDNSDLFIWIFLSFVALIIVAQLIPAIILCIGLVKSFTKNLSNVLLKV